MDTNKLKAQLAAMQDEINRTAEQYGLGGYLQQMMNGGEIHQLPVMPYGFAQGGTKNDPARDQLRSQMMRNLPIRNTPIVKNSPQSNQSPPPKSVTKAPVKQPVPSKTTQPSQLSRATGNFTKSGTVNTPTGKATFTSEADLIRQMERENRMTGAPDSKGVYTLKGVNINTTRPNAVVASRPTPVLNTSSSIVDLMKSMGDDSSFANRKKVAESMGIKGYTGTVEQNKELMQKYLVSKQAQALPIVEQPYSFDEVPGNTGAMMMDDGTINPVILSNQGLPIMNNMDIIDGQTPDLMQYNTGNFSRSASGATPTGSFNFITEEDLIRQMEAEQQGQQYYAGGEIENDPHIMELYGFQGGGQIMEIPVAPYGYAEMGMMMGDDVSGKPKPTGAPTTPKMMNSQQLAGLATQFFSRDPSMQSPLPNFVGSYQLSDMDKTLMMEAMKQMKGGQGSSGAYPAITPQMIDQIRPMVEQNRLSDQPRGQRMGGMNYEDGGQMPMDVAVSRFKAAGRDKGLSGGELQMYVEKMKSKYNYQKGGVVKEQELGNYEVGTYGSGGIMYDGTKFPGYNKAINTAPGDKFKKQMLLEKGGKIKLVKFGHR